MTTTLKPAVTMQAVVLHEEGGPDVLRLEDVDRPDPGPGEVRVRMYAASLNHLDLWIRKGMPSVPKPRIMGADGVGVVNELGPGVDDSLLGERVVLEPAITCGRCRACLAGRTVACPSFQVLGEHRPGTHAEFVVVPAVNVHRVPPHLDDDAAAALGLTFATAWRMLHARARLEAGERVFIWGASSGVGTAALELARAIGAETIVASRSRDKLEILVAMGADHAVDLETDDVAARVRDITDGLGVEVVFDHLGEVAWKPSLQMLQVGGRMVTCGATTGANPPAAITRLFWKQLSILGSTMADKRDFAQMLRVVGQHELTPRVDRVFDVSEVREAHSYLEEARQIGKVVLKLN